MADVVPPKVRERIRKTAHLHHVLNGYKAISSPSHPSRGPAVTYEPRFVLYDDEPADPHDGLSELVQRRGALLVQREAPTVGDFVEPAWSPESHYCRAAR